jgi:hypothetical protein
MVPDSRTPGVPPLALLHTGVVYSDSKAFLGFGLIRIFEETVFRSAVAAHTFPPLYLRKL